MSNRCYECDADTAPKRCGRCKAVYYCSTECQKKSWKSHKRECRAAPVARVEVIEDEQDVQEEKRKFPKLYFKRLLHGESVSLGQSMVHQVAKTQKNYSYLLGDEKVCIIVDPCWDVRGLFAQAEADGRKVIGCIATHYHYDHIGGQLPPEKVNHLAGLNILPGVKDVCKQCEGPCWIHKFDYDNALEQTKCEAMKKVEDMEIIEVGEMKIRVLHTPGHTPGSISLLLDQFKPARVLTGDCLFVGSTGRLDSDSAHEPGAAAGAMWDSLHKLAMLPEDTIVYPAHEYSKEKQSTIGKEKVTNWSMRVPRAKFVKMNQKKK